MQCVSSSTRTSVILWIRMGLNLCCMVSFNVQRNAVVAGCGWAISSAKIKCGSSSPVRCADCRVVWWENSHGWERIWLVSKHVSFISCLCGFFFYVFCAYKFCFISTLVTFNLIGDHIHNHAPAFCFHCATSCLSFTICCSFLVASVCMNC
jgi:hypothetical protein